MCLDQLNPSMCKASSVWVQFCSIHYVRQSPHQNFALVVKRFEKLCSVDLEVIIIRRLSR